MSTPPLAVNLAATYEHGTPLTFSKFASPKLDGIRAVIIDGKAYSRNMKLIPNLTVQQYFVDGYFNGFDGELISGAHTADVFTRTSSVVRSINGSTDWGFYAFDFVPPSNCSMRFETRLDMLKHYHSKAPRNSKVSIVEQALINNFEELDAYEAKALADGYEGVMLRNPSALYKHGRSTANSQDLLKVKRFEDSEAVVIGWSPMVDKDGAIKLGLVGALEVRDISTGIEFSVGSGFTLMQRADMYQNKPRGQVMTYQHFPQGSYDKPRFPTFKGFRTDVDFTSAPYLHKSK